MSAPDRASGLMTIDEMKDRLNDRIGEVINRYGRVSGDAYEKGERYFMLNPGRADNSVGSFFITTSGPDIGRWCDFAMAPLPGNRSSKCATGDVLDFIALSLGIADRTELFKVAREFLGLSTESPEDKARRDKARAEREAAQEQEKARREAAKAKNRDRAYALWLSGQETIIGTPVDAYLKGRGIDLSILAHRPRAVRFHPECRYYFDTELVNDETGEITKGKAWRPMPAMLTAIARGPKIIDCHRIYLARRPDGSWGKADLPDGKKVFTDYTGGCARLSGETGPRGGHLRLAQAPQGARVYIAEGIENALSLVALRALSGKPPAFVVAAGSIWNMAHVELPAQIGEVVLLADNDQHDQARDGLRRAQKAHQDKGRTVRTWASPIAGEDINDALKRALQDQKGAA